MDLRFHSTTNPDTPFREAVTKSFVAAIRIKRAELELTQAELAEKLGVSPSILSDIKKGRRPLSLDLMQKIITFFNLQFTVTFESYGSTRPKE